MSEEGDNQVLREELVKEEEINIEEIDEVEQILDYGKVESSLRNSNQSTQGLLIQSST